MRQTPKKGFSLKEQKERSESKVEKGWNRFI